MRINSAESLRVKTYFFNYYVKRTLLLKENLTQLSNLVEIKMQVSKEEFALVSYIFLFLFNRKPYKFIKKEKYGQKQEKLPLSLRFSRSQFYSILFYFRYWFSILALKNKQLYSYKKYMHKVNIQFMELSILFKNVSFSKVIDLYGLLSDLYIDIYISRGNVNDDFSSYYSLFRYNFIN